MVKKKITCFGCVLLLLCLLCLPVNAVELLRLTIEQVQTDWPETAIWLHLMDTQDAMVDLSAITPQDITVTTDGVPLTVTRVAAAQNTTYFYLLDVSTSMPQDALEQVKSAILAQWELLGADEHIVVVTFGEEITVICDENDTPASAEKKLAQVTATQQATRLYDGLGKIADHMASLDRSLATRGVVILVTDGVNYSTDGTTRTQVLEKLKQESLTLCILGVEKGTNSDEMSNIGELANASGGWAAITKVDALATTLKFMQEQLKKSICVFVSSDSNVIGANDKIFSVSLQYNGQSYTQAATVQVTKWQKDDEAPTVDLLEVTANSLILQYSEAVLGGEDVSNYCITGKDISITPDYIEYNAVTHTAVLSFAQTVYNGDYTLIIQNITDDSNEKNPLQEQEFSFTQTEYPIPWNAWIKQHEILAAGLAVGLILIIGFGILALIVVKNRKMRNAQQEALAVGADSIDGMRLIIEQGHPIEIVIAPPNGQTQRIRAQLHEGNLFIIGRSADEATLGIEDDALSRKHFALEWQVVNANDGCIILTDLDSTNGTMLNGVIIHEPRPLNDGDVITAGGTKFIIYY